MKMTIHRAGPLSTVQDLGRGGHRAAGVPACGAADEVAIRLANLLVGNPETAAAIEATMGGPLVSFSEDCTIAACGATAAGLSSWRPIRVTREEQVDLRVFADGFRAYLAVAGGIDVPPVLGSRSTDLRNGFGGVEGRRLRDGDRLAIVPAAGPPAPPSARPSTDLIPPYSAAAMLRVLRGRHAGLVESSFFSGCVELTVSPESDRVGIRLDGLAATGAIPGDLASRVTCAGTVQLPPDGRPIILGPDAGTIGGYAEIAHVVAVDLPLLAQLPPGGRLRFAETTLEDAHRSLRERERAIAVFRAALRHGR